MALLEGKIALVTGASRGIGRGVAIELAREGASVVVAARTMSPDRPARIDGDGLPIGGTLSEVVDQIRSEGGNVHAVSCDLSEEKAIEDLISETQKVFGHIDILVNNGMPQHTMIGKFWELPSDVYDAQMTIGPRSYYLAARYCVAAMILQGSGVIVNISSPGSCTDFYGAPYCISRAASDRMAQAFAHDLKGTGVRVYSLWPSFIRTERLVMAAEGKPTGFDLPDGFDPNQEANSPEMVGRAIAYLAADDGDTDRNGTVVTMAELADKYDFTDLDGRPAMRLPSVKYLLEEFGRVTPLAFTKITS